MDISPLNKADKKKIWFEIKQVLVSYLAVGIVLLIICAAAVIFILKYEVLQLRREFVVPLIVTGFIGGFVGFLINSIQPYLKDLKYGFKNIYSATIIDKVKNTNWGWHGNPAADFNSQPKLEEFFLVTDDQKIFVEKEEYNKFNIGDRINIGISVGSKILLDITKNCKRQVTQ